MRNASNPSLWPNITIDRALTTGVATSMYGLYRYVPL